MGMLGKFVAGAAGSLGKQMEETRQTEEKTKAASSLEELRGRIQAQLEEKRQTFEAGQTDKKLAFETGQTDKKIAAESTERGLDRTQRGELAAYEASRADARERAAADRADKQFRLDQQRLAVEIKRAQAAESKGERVDPAKLLTGIDQADKSLAEREALATTAEEKAQIREDRIAFDRLRKSIIMGGMGIRPLAAEGQPAPGDSKGSVDETKDKKPGKKPSSTGYGTGGHPMSEAELREIKIGVFTPRDLIDKAAAAGNEAALRWLKGQREAAAEIRSGTNLGY